MSGPTLHDAPVARLGERDMLGLLHGRYSRVSMGARRYAVAEHVPDGVSFAKKRIADFIAVDCYMTGEWPRERRYNPIHGHEVKVSRSDWLAELRDPSKAEAWVRHCHFWWLVVPDPAIVRDDLPAGWGLMVARGGRLHAVQRAELRIPAPMSGAMVAALLRATAKTAARGAG